PSALTAELHSISAGMGVTMSAAVGTPTTISLSSSAPNIATVPATVTIPAGSTTASFFIDPLAIGQSTITATLPPAAGGATSHATVDVSGPRITFAPSHQSANAGGTTTLTLSLSTPQPSDVNVALTSSDNTTITVPASI